MKKILIISYFFPPCNVTSAQRIGSWEKYLPNYGFHPIIVTRNWTGSELNEKSRLEKSGNKERAVNKEKSTIHYLPYKPNLRDWFFVRSEKNLVFRLLSKIFTLLNLVSQNLCVRCVPYNNLYFKAKEILKTNQDLEYLIISGNPFEQFYFGYLLKKEFPHIKWIVDYRDEWTTSEITEFSGLKKFIWNINRYSEKKWVGKADLITANTKYATRKLERFHRKKAVLLLNGYEIPQQETPFETQFKKLTILHNGTLYPTQDTALLKEALSEVKIPENFIIELNFPGVKNFKNVADKIEREFAGLPIKLYMSERIPQKELMKMQHEADVMLMVAHKGKKGIIGSKLYEYIGLRKPVLLCPSDNDELESTLIETNLGIIASDKKTLINELDRLIEMKKSEGKIMIEPNEFAINKLSRKEQVCSLSEYINKLQ